MFVFDDDCVLVEDSPLDVGLGVVLHLVQEFYLWLLWLVSGDCALRLVGLGSEGSRLYLGQGSRLDLLVELADGLLFLMLRHSRFVVYAHWPVS